MKKHLIRLLIGLIVSSMIYVFILYPFIVLIISIIIFSYSIGSIITWLYKNRNKTVGQVMDGDNE